MSTGHAWFVVLAAAAAVTLLAVIVRRRRDLGRRTSDTLAQLGRAERAVRLIVSQRDEALAAQNRAEALGSAMLREHHALREACFDLAKRWESLPGEGPCGHAEQLRRVVRLHGWDAP
ncbi:hypothetical protein FHX41_2319 [Actinomadura hallensis]|uniref:Uncharacterized protein n=1 Tax=Actinomadura hallensis TaxID=337895 RepID=A0A543IDL4_9ACTN|nr:hypothetical protein [Actinomadura hallensis]TQM68668.1 hypothetical protein FHX41_2319 [Actinomadura hallensis]HLV76142.1 hypothetical protein [Vulgatibacteraceae bacterium]